MPSWYQPNVKVKAERRELQRIRELGYDHGFAGRPAITSELHYQQAYKRGTEARRDLLLNDLDEEG